MAGRPGVVVRHASSSFRPRVGAGQPGGAQRFVRRAERARVRLGSVSEDLQQRRWPGAGGREHAGRRDRRLPRRGRRGGPGRATGNHQPPDDSTHDGDARPGTHAEGRGIVHAVLFVPGCDGVSGEERAARDRDRDDQPAQRAPVTREPVDERGKHSASVGRRGECRYTPHRRPARGHEHGGRALRPRSRLASPPPERRRSSHGFRRQPRATSAIADRLVSTATAAATGSEAASVVSCAPASP